MTAFCGMACLVHLASIFAALIRRKARPGASSATRADAPAVTIVRPVCAIANHIAETPESSVNLDCPNYEVLFCVASRKGPRKSPIVPTVAALLCRYPKARAPLLVGDERISTGPKLNNSAKGWKAAANDLIVIADSNVPMPRGYIQRLFEPCTEKIGLACSPPTGGRPQGISAELECAILNPYQARAQDCADAIGTGFAQGMSRSNPILSPSRQYNVH